MLPRPQSLPLLPLFCRTHLFFERGQVAFWQALGAGLQNAPHDLATARLGQLRHEGNFLGLGDRTHLMADVVLQLFRQRFARLVAGFENT